MRTITNTRGLVKKSEVRRPLHVGDLVRILPEVFPEDERPNLVLARVITIGQMVEFHSLPNEFVADMLSFFMEADDAMLLPRAKHAEVVARSTICHRLHVWCVQRNTFRLTFGQVDGLAHPYARDSQGSSLVMEQKWHQSSQAEW